MKGWNRRARGEAAVAALETGMELSGLEKVTTMADKTCQETMSEAEFRAFYRRTARPLRAYIARSVSDWELADDMLQESYLRLLRSSLVTDDDSYRRSYLYRIATNMIRDHYRRNRPDSEELNEAMASIEGGHAERFRLRSDVGLAMTDLGVRDRQMLWLAYVEGSSHAEIAGILGLKTASIRSMLFRARERLATVLRSRGLAPETTRKGSA